MNLSELEDSFVADAKCDEVLDMINVWMQSLDFHGFSSLIVKYDISLCVSLLPT